jgi:hypothetical protein
VLLNPLRQTCFGRVFLKAVSRALKASTRRKEKPSALDSDMTRNVLWPKTSRNM